MSEEGLSKDYVLVPIEATREMVDAAMASVRGDIFDVEREDVEAIYRAMVAAAPKSPKVD